MGSVAQAMWDQLHRLSGPLHRLCGIGCTGYVVRCTGYVGMLHRLCGVKADNTPWWVTIFEMVGDHPGDGG